MRTISIKVCLHQTKLIIGTESFPVLDTVYHFITTTVFFGGYEFQCDGTLHKMSLSVSGKSKV